jgi:hypothetical protein
MTEQEGKGNKNEGKKGREQTGSQPTPGKILSTDTNSKPIQKPRR